MLKDTDQSYFLESLRNNRCVLFIGAGFSANALNKFDQPIPDAAALAGILWEWQGLSGGYDGSPLGEVYQSALHSGRPLATLRELLESHLLAVKLAPWYYLVPKFFWMRLYGTNVDNVVELAFAGASVRQNLDVVVAQRNDVRDRDQFLASIQYIKLNGSLPGDPGAITFATRQYAKRSAEYDRWYDCFVRDFVFQPTVFIGTELREPLFWQAIESRQKRGDNPEERPRSFLVTPTISPAKVPILDSLNIVHVPASGQQFFDWLQGVYDFPTRAQVLQLVAPEAVELFTDVGLQQEYRDALEGFLTVFPRVPVAHTVAHHTKMFFLGTPPVWADITNEFDSPREFTSRLLGAIRTASEEVKSIGVVGILGAGGSGKSTVLHRLALTLRQEGKHVFYSDGGQRPALGVVEKGLRELPDRGYLFVDNAPLFGRAFIDMIRSTATLKRPPIVVFAARYNLFERDLSEIAGPQQNVRIFEVPDLSDADISNLIHTLERHRQLGKLENLSASRRFREFKTRAKKQILVAMREATQGRGFDEIIKSEFGEIEGEEARVLFLCAALATAELLDLSSKQWLACAVVTPAEALRILRRDLKGLLVEHGAEARVAARHPIIAEFIVERVANRQELMEAYRRVLAALSHDIYSGPGRRQRSWRLFVRLINHRRIYERFTKDLAMARAIYESIAEWFRRDGHFWLQYTNLELEFGDLPYARLHLAHAESLMPDDDLVLTTKAHLGIRESCSAGSRQEAMSLRSDAEDILLEQIRRVGDEDEYPYHVYLTQMLSWIHRWELDRAVRTTSLHNLFQVAIHALELHPSNTQIRQIHDDIKREYLSQATLKRR